jgi:hypothetical protein
VEQVAADGKPLNKADAKEAMLDNRLNQHTPAGIFTVRLPQLSYAPEERRLPIAAQDSIPPHMTSAILPAFAAICKITCNRSAAMPLRKHWPG